VLAGLAGLAAERGTSLRDVIDHLVEEARWLRRQHHALSQHPVFGDELRGQ